MPTSGTAPSALRPGPAGLASRGWPSRRAPRWAIPAVAVVAGIALSVGLAHRPSRSERAADLRGYLYTVTFDIESCAGPVHDSLAALRAVNAGTSPGVAAAAEIAGNGAAQCSPAANELLDDLENYQVSESLASYRLQAAVTGLIAWAAPDAERVQADIAMVLRARGTPAEAADLAALHRAQAVLDRQRAAVDKVLAPAIAALDPSAALPALPG